MESVVGRAHRTTNKCANNEQFIFLKSSNMANRCDTHRANTVRWTLVIGRHLLFRNMEYLTLSGEDITGTATETDPRLYYFTKYPELFLVDEFYCVQDG